MKRVTLQVPDGKRAGWINGILTLVDDQEQDSRPVTERIKTFDDACRELGVGHNLVTEWRDWEGNCSADIAAYLKLRVIVAALNEGWEPQFTEHEWRWYPCFHLYTEDELSDKTGEWKTAHALKMLGDRYPSDYFGLAFALSYNDTSNTNVLFGSSLFLKSEALATYCGKQFVDIWADFYLIWNPNAAT